MLTKQLKALYGAAVAGLGSAETAYAAHHAITWGDGLHISSVALVAYGVVWAVPNYVRVKRAARRVK